MWPFGPVTLRTSELSLSLQLCPKNLYLASLFTNILAPHPFNLLSCTQQLPVYAMSFFNSSNPLVMIPRSKSSHDHPVVPSVNSFHVTYHTDYYEKMLPPSCSLTRFSIILFEISRLGCCSWRRWLYPASNFDRHDYWLNMEMVHNFWGRMAFCKSTSMNH